METPTCEPYFNATSILILAILSLTIHHLLRRRTINPPPGPKPWPIIGNFNLIGPLPHRSLHDLSKTYGPIMMLKFGSVPVVVGSSVEMAKLILRTHDAVFSGRPKTAAGKYTTYDYSNITWSQYGKYLRLARKLCLMELFSPKRLESSEDIRAEELNLMLNSIYEAKGKPIFVKDYLLRLSLNVISRTVLGKTYINDKEESSIISPKEFRDMLDELFLLNGVFNIGDWIPCVKFLDLQGYVKRMKILGKRLDVFMEHVLDEHYARKEKEKGSWVAKDMVDVLIQHAQDPNFEVEFTRKRIKGFTQDLISGGTESSAITIEWVLSELLRRPHILAKTTEELNQVVGNERWIKEKDMQNLPYIRATLKETLRLHPAGPFLVPHMSHEHVKVQGYDVPKGSLILVNTYTIQRDPEVYPNPEEFMPERFFTNQIDFKGQDFELLPFGSGRRMCPGYNLGIKIIELGLANLLHGFTWRLPHHMKPEDLNMEEKFGISIPRKVPLVACAEPRFHPQMYQGGATINKIW